MTLLAMENETEAEVLTVASVYSLPGCWPCGKTYELFIELGVDIEINNMAVDTEAHATATGLGYKQSPVVITADGEHWSGLNPDRVKDTAARQDNLVPYDKEFARRLVDEIKDLIEQGVPKIQVINGEIIIPVEDESELVA